MEEINGLTQTLLESEFPEEITEEAIMVHKDLIHEIASMCRETGIFKDSVDRYNDAKLEFKEDKIVKSYMWFLNRICSAPTSLHMHGAVRLCLPIVDDFIQEKLGVQAG